LGDPNLLKTKLDRWCFELNWRKNGSPWDRTFYSAPDLTVTELAAQTIGITRALSEALEKGLAEGKYR
jgi:hypothetical protein